MRTLVIIYYNFTILPNYAAAGVVKCVVGEFDF